MEDNVLLAKPLSYDRGSCTLTLQIDNFDDLVEELIIEWMTSSKVKKIKIQNISLKKLRTYKQLQKWHAKLTAIIKYDDPSIKVTKAMLDSFSFQMKLRIFEAEVLWVGPKHDIPIPPSLATMELEPLSRGIEKLEEAYNYC